MFKKPFIISIIATATLGTVFPAIVSADEVVLTLKNQDVTIRGEFAGFQQNAYVVTTENGDLHVPAKYVDCEGDDCLIFVSVNTQGN
jgi:hypothetical protein